jgi:MoaA/NifB/PqqE/SkfB family radical SAM enzyme
MEWCGSIAVMAGVTTNGSALSRRNVERLVAAKPFNINISVDGPSAEVHDYLRGYPGLFDRLSNGIRYVVEERKRQGVSFPVVIKPTITSRNFRYLPDMVAWAQEIGATSLSMQPVNRWTPETYDELWIEEADLPAFERVIDQLIAMKRAGAPILTSENILSLMPDHFRGKKASKDLMPCRVGMRNFYIQADGDVQSCFLGFPVMGNLKTQSAREIWYGDEARNVRRDTVACDKLCLLTCVSQKSLSDKVKMGLQLIRGQ